METESANNILKMGPIISIEAFVLRGGIGFFSLGFYQFLLFSLMASVCLLLVGLLVLAAGVVALQKNSDGGETVVMEEEELLGLFEVMDALLEDPSWAEMHPQPCTDTPWPGVQCEISQDPLIFHVTKIHVGPDVLIPPCKANANLPAKSLLKLPYLRTLSIFDCFLTSPVSLSPTLFGAFSSLEHLALESNPSLHGVIPASLGEVANLRILCLSQNNLQGEIPKELGGLGSLEQLDLSYNNLSGEIPVEIGGLKSLTILDISWNGLEGRVPYTLGQLQLLQKRLVLLDLSNNFLTGPIPQTLSGMEQLEYLLIQYNPLNTGIPLFIGTFRKLTVLSFSGCGLTGPIPKYFPFLRNLTALSLDKNSLNGIIPPDLGTLPRLDQLNLSQNHLSGELLFPEEFINRLGKRLDVRGNSGLCTSNRLYEKNISLYLSTPACLHSAESSNNKSWAEPQSDDCKKMKPSWEHGIRSSNTPVLNQDLLLPYFFVWFLRFLFLQFTIIPYFLQRKTRFIVHAAVLLLHKTGITNPSLTYNEKQMESALRLHCYTLPRTPLPLRIPSSYHAANLQFSFRRSPFSPGKGFRSYPARQILGPITCAASGFRTPSRRNKANDHNMAKRVGRASFTLACVIGIIGCSFWVKQEVMAARQVGKVSYQMRSAAREGVSMRPDSATKANPQCKCYRDRRIAIQTGSESNTNANLQKSNSQVPASVPQALDKVEDLPQSKLVPPQASSPPQGGESASSSSVSRESLLSQNKAEEQLKPELQGKTIDVKVSQIDGMVEHLPLSQLVPPPQGGVRASSSNVSRESLLSENEAEKQLKPELQGQTSDVKVRQIDGIVEDLLLSLLVPPPQDGVRASSSSVSRESLLSEIGAEKPELQGKTSDVKVPQVVAKVEDLPKSQSVPQQASSPPQGGERASSSSVGRESLPSENKAEKHLKPELQGKTSDVKVPQVVAKVGDLPQSQLVPQQASSTVSKKSLLSEDRAEKHLKPEAQEELQGKSSDVKVNSSMSATYFSPSQSPQIDSGVGAVTAFNKGSLASPLVSITFKVDPSPMPSLTFVSPSTIMPVEPRHEKSKSDRDDGTKVLVRGVPVSPSIAPMVEEIFAEHGDITANCLFKDQAFRGYLVEGLVTVMQLMQEYPARKLTHDDFRFMYRKLEDLERVKVNVGWLREQIEALGPFLNVVEYRRKWETMVAEVEKMRAKLSEQEAKLALAQKHILALHEGALAQKHTDKEEGETQGTIAQKHTVKEEVETQGTNAQKHTDKEEVETQETNAQKHTDKEEIETQGTKNLKKEDEPDDEGLWQNLGTLLHAFGFGSLFYLLFLSK
ncbi:unnamed protein product, partial [Vitis vinifera]